jgi:predicted DNA-binding protein YlxM (UPF0122 family)
MAKNRKLTNKQLDTIKRMFMEYKTVSAIAREFSVSRNTITHHINQHGWTAERKLNETELLSTFSDGKKASFTDMTESSVIIMKRALQDLATRATPPSINEAIRAADILKTLDNILRLDDGKPTDIVESTEKAMDNKELKKKLSADPFSGITEDEDEEDNKTLN